MVAISRLSDQLAKSSYTYEWLIQRLSENDEVFKNRIKDTNIQKISCRDIGDGTGFMSKIYKVEICFEDGGKPHSVIFKLAQPESINKQLKQHANSANGQKKEVKPVDATCQHQREVQFYAKFANTNDLPLPKIFAGEFYIKDKQDGTILMEDLSDKAVLCDFIQSLSVKQILSVTKMLAKLAAMSLSSLTQADLLQQYKITPLCLHGIRVVQKMLSQKLAETYPELFADIIGKLGNVITSAEYGEYASSGVNTDLGIPAVLSHNDLHNMNIFWKKNPDGSCGDEIYSIIDWQTVFAGSIGYDLAGFMVLTLDGDIRRQCEVWLFDYFHAILKAELQVKGLKMPFTVDQIKASYRRTFTKNALFLLICGPTVVAKHGSKKEQVDSCHRRIQCALEDSLKFLQEDLPQFL